MYSVDVLLVVDDTVGMSTAQSWLARDIDTLTHGLATLPGGPDYQIGVVTTDMGIGKYANAGCSKEGDGARLLIPSGCPRPKGNVEYVKNEAGKVNVSSTVFDAVSCYIKSQGTDGCGFEQPLKAMRAALGGVNKGFVRQEAALAVVILTNEDDCSATAEDLFNSEDSSFGPYSSYRCFRYGVLCSNVQPPLHPTLLGGCTPAQSWLEDVETRYADFLKGLKPEGWVSVLVLAGPSSKTVKVENGNNGVTVKESCAGVGIKADPSFRLEQFVARLGQNGAFASICKSSYRSALQSLLQRIKAAF